MDDPIPEENAQLVRYLKTLVTTLTATMIAGFIVLITVIVMRFQQEGTVPLPENVTLPEGAVAIAVTRGPDFLLVVTQDERIFLLNLDGEVTREIVAGE
ncbi:MAG: hypothetical protein CR993_01290 [Rhodobacterales bacterium]|nr:MAG: hypothetical protein CR993_01290 [Rhodobacterales bacterium]